MTSDLSTLPKLSFTKKNKKDQNDTKEPKEQKDKKEQKESKRKSEPKNIPNETKTIEIQSSEPTIDSQNIHSEKKNKIGTYASTEFQNWLNTPIQKPKIKRSKKTSDDAFQIFQDFSDRTENEDWKLFFQKLYQGKFPHGYSYRNQTLFFRKRTKIEKLDIQDNSNETMNKVMSFFKVFGGFSNFGQDTNIFDYLVSQTPMIKSWKEIRSKKTKQFYIQKYVDELTQKYQLSSTERKSLLDTIHTGFMIKCIESSDIEFENQKINLIRTIHWLPEQRKFELSYQNRLQKTSRKATAEKVSKNSFFSHWNKFLQHIVVKNKPSNLDDIPTDVSINTEDLTDITTISSFTDS
jgi:hypothetical protein